MLKWIGSKLARRKPAERPIAGTLDTSVTAPAEASDARARTAQVVPALLLATGTGVAFWWWTQWARGQAESDGTQGDEADSGETGAASKPDATPKGSGD